MSTSNPSPLPQVPDIERSPQPVASPGPPGQPRKPSVGLLAGLCLVASLATALAMWALTNRGVDTSSVSGAAAQSRLAVATGGELLKSLRVGWDNRNAELRCDSRAPDARPARCRQSRPDHHVPCACWQHRQGRGCRGAIRAEVARGSYRGCRVRRGPGGVEPQETHRRHSDSQRDRTPGAGDRQGRIPEGAIGSEDLPRCALRSRPRC